MLKLVTIVFENSPRLRNGPRIENRIDCETPNGNLVAWRAILRGPSLFLVSPPGWKNGVTANLWDAAGPSTMYEFPRASLTLEWNGAPEDVAEIAKGKFETPPFGPPARPGDAAVSRSILSQLDPSQMGDA